MFVEIVISGCVVTVGHILKVETVTLYVKHLER